MLETFVSARCALMPETVTGELDDGLVLDCNVVGTEVEVLEFGLVLVVDELVPKLVLGARVVVLLLLHPVFGVVIIVELFQDVELDELQELEELHIDELEYE